MSRIPHRHAPHRHPISRALPVLLLLAILLAAGTVFASGLTSSLDRSRVAEGEAVVLTVTTSSGEGGTPDWGPLQQDFDLLGQGQSTQMRVVNGRSSTSREWRLTLLPKRTGTIQIPPIRLGGLVSQALRLEVLPAAEAAEAGMPQPVLLEVEASPERPFVQQKLIYTVRLLYTAGLADASLGEPRVDEALVYPLGEERPGSVERGGQRYQVIERRYAVLPQRSGTLRIEGPVLNARVAEPSARGYGVARPMQRRAPDLETEIMPPPPAATDPWLPAESLAIDAAWVGGAPEFRVGEPVTRTLAITAQGLTAEQLPEVSLDAPGMQVYPDRSRAETRPEGGTLVAQRLLTAAYVPTQAGEVLLPEVRIAWWDVARGAPAEARLPAQPVRVLAAPPGSAPAQTPMAPATASGPAAPAAVATDADAEGGSPWPWLALLLAVGWAASAAFLWHRGRGAPADAARATPATTATHRRSTTSSAPSAPAAAIKPAPAGASPGSLAQAFAAGDAQAARQALLDWAGAHWPADPPRNLEQLGARLAPAAEPLLQSIDRALYGGGGDQWDGPAAWAALQPLLAADVRGRRADTGAALPPLYPTRGSA